MTEKNMLLKLIEEGKTMRNYQKDFFKATDYKTKKDAMINAKQAERSFDNTIINIEQLMK